MMDDTKEISDEVTVERSATTVQKLTSWALVPVRKAMEVPSLRAKRREVDLRPFTDATPPDEPSHARLILWSLLIVVLLPILASGLYLFAFASDQYAAETRFAVRTLTTETKSKPSDSSVQNVLSTAGLSGQDAELVASYIHSRAIIDDISKRLDVRAIFRRPEADFLMRLGRHASIEDLTEYWNSMVSAYIESSSGIVTVQVRAFRREDALDLAQAILQSSEALVEALSLRVRQDLVQHAELEVDRSKDLVHTALTDLQSYRNTQGLIDPVKNADNTSKLLLQLMTDKIQAESQLFVSQRTTGLDAPGVAPLQAKLDSINTQITDLQQRMAGTKDSKSNLAALISQFEELDLKRQFAERLYSLTQEGLTKARLAAERRAVYFAVFMPPSLPEDYSYPMRYSAFFLIALTALMTWCSGATIWASILDHKL